MKVADNVYLSATANENVVIYVIGTGCTITVLCKFLQLHRAFRSTSIGFAYISKTLAYSICRATKRIVNNPLSNYSQDMNRMLKRHRLMTSVFPIEILNHFR